jgi:predicted TIM-barrel fold metal-dependent hydrolase
VFDVHSYFGGSLVPGVAHSGAVIHATMQARGIEGAVLFAAHARNVDPLAGNRVLQKVLEQSPGCYGCLVTHVNRVDASVTAMRELMVSRKFVGMAMVGMRSDAPIPRIVADDIVNAYRRYGKPLFLYALNAEMTHAALEIARAYTMLKVILIGMGGLDWRTAIAAAHASTNIVLETSGALDRAKLPAAVEAVGAHRLIFGSGTPHVDAAAGLGLVEDSHLTDEARRRILSDNAHRLFGMDTAEPS